MIAAAGLTRPAATAWVAAHDARVSGQAARGEGK